MDEMERIVREMDEFQKGNKNVHKPLKDWKAKLSALMAKASPIKGRLRGICGKITEEVGRLNHVAIGYAEMSLRAMENSILLHPEACSSSAALEKNTKKRQKEDAAVRDQGTWTVVTESLARQEAGLAAHSRRLEKMEGILTSQAKTMKR